MNINNLPQTSGIYRIINKINGHSYIGQSNNIMNRIKYHHLCDYDNPKCSQYDTKFYKAIRKYGWDNFELEILELCPVEELDKKEIYYIGLYNTYKNGYNSTIGGQFWAPNIHSKEIEKKREETREKNKSLKDEKHPRARLTNEEVRYIRQRYINGESVDDIYKDYKIKYPNKDVLRNIILGNSYKTAGNIPPKKSRFNGIKLTEKQVKEIRRRYVQEKISYANLGKEYNVSASTIQKVIRKEGYYSLI